MTSLPMDDTARQRLLAAQRAETDALKRVQTADRARGRVQLKLDEATRRLDAAKLNLIGVSGLSRAALLLAQDEADLRRIRRAALAPGAPAVDTP